MEEKNHIALLKALEQLPEVDAPSRLWAELSFRLDESLLEVVRAYYRAWQERDFENLMLDENVKYRSPMFFFTRLADLKSALIPAAATMIRFENMELVVQGNKVCAKYQVISTLPAGVIPMTEWFTIEKGIITEVEIFFDSSLFK